MQIGIFAKTFAVQGAAPVLQAVRAAGFETVQFNMACVGLPSLPDEIPSGVAKDIAEAAGATHISIAAVSATYNMIHPDIAVRSAGQVRLSTMMAVANAMGTQLVTLCTGTRDPNDQWHYHPDNGGAAAWKDLLAEMAQAIAMADKYEVDLGIEPELANVVSSAEKAQQLIKELQSPRLRIVLDPANLFEAESSERRDTIVAKAVDLLGDRVAMAHAKDRDDNGGFAAAGRGVIDFRYFIACLRGAGFDGPLVAHGLSEAEAPAVAHFLKGIVAE